MLKSRKTPKTVWALLHSLRHFLLDGMPNKLYQVFLQVLRITMMYNSARLDQCTDLEWYLSVFVNLFVLKILDLSDFVNKKLDAMDLFDFVIWKYRVHSTCLANFLLTQTLPVGRHAQKVISGVSTGSKDPNDVQFSMNWSMYRPWMTFIRFCQFVYLEILDLSDFVNKKLEAMDLSDFVIWKYPVHSTCLATFLSNLSHDCSSFFD